MKRALEGWYKINRLLAGLVLIGMLGACARSGGAEYFTAVDYVEQRPGIAHDSSAPVHYVAPLDTQWRSLVLPHVMPRPIAGKPVGQVGPAEDWVTHWYRVRYPLPRQLAQPLAIYIPRWHPFSGRMDVYVNGDHVAVIKDSVWNHPVFVPIPAAIAARGGNHIEVLIATSLQQSAGGALSALWVGPSDALQWHYAWRQFLQLSFPQITSISFLVLGAFAFAFWIKRRDEVAYLLFAAMALVNFVRTLHYYIYDPEWLMLWFWWLTINSLAWLMVLANLFALRMHGQRFPRIERALIGIVVTVSLVSAVVPAFGFAAGAMSPLLYLAQIMAGILVAGLTTAGALRNRSHTGLSVAVALWLNFAMGAHDWLLQSWKISLESVYLLPYGSMCMMAVFLYAVLQRYLAAVHQAEELNVSLEQRVQAQAQALKESHDKLRVIERQQTIADERQRLMREMHDGLGSSLMSSLVMVEQGELDNKAVANVLRESIDDLKLTIDSLEPIDDDLLALLATLRYRVGKRLELAGLKLVWKVRETPPLPWLNPTTALQVLRIVQEALTNILKHAHATEIRVETDHDDRYVFVRLTDNGRGFDVVATRSELGGRGLLNMQRRAATLKGCVEFVSVQGQTTVTIKLPRLPIR